MAFLNQHYTNNHVSLLEEDVKRNNICAMNLMGVMIFKGIYFEKDTSRAEEIFLDLSNRNYPESQINYLLAISKRSDVEPEFVINLSLGLYYKFADDKKYSNYATIAEEVGRRFIDEYKSKVPTFPINDEIEKRFEIAIREAKKDIAIRRLKYFSETKAQSDNLIAILSFGLAAYNISSRINNYSSSNTGYRINGTETWLNRESYDAMIGRRPLHLNLYQFPGSYW